MIYADLCDVVARAPATSGVRQGDRFVPYTDVVEQAGRIATGLIERGIARGTPIGLLMINGPDLLILAYAVFAAGAVVVPLNAHAPRAELAATARKAHIGAVIASQPFAEVAGLLIADLTDGAGLPLFISGGTADNSVAT